MHKISHQNDSFKIVTYQDWGKKIKQRFFVMFKHELRKQIQRAVTKSESEMKINWQTVNAMISEKGIWSKTTN